jgi:hypothetical protein
MTYLNDDEVVARALQEQYDREFQGVQPSQDNVVVRGQPVNRPSSRSSDPFQYYSSSRPEQPASTYGFTSGYAEPRHRPVPTDSFESAFDSEFEDDEEFASRRRLEQHNRGSGAGTTVLYEQSSADINRQFERAMAVDEDSSRSVRAVGNNNGARFESLGGGYPIGSSLSSTSMELEDAEFARRLQEQIRQEEQVLAAAAARKKQSQRNSTSTPLTSRTGSDISALTMDAVGDVERADRAARRTEQERLDEQVARRLAAKEQERIRRANRRFSFCCVVNWILPVVVIAAVAVGVAYYFMRPGALNNIIFPTPEDFRNEDPFAEIDPSEADAWQNRGEGLELEAVNALEPSWYEYFNLAVHDWNNGSPSSVLLLTSVADYDYGCEPITGKLKVCNGNYGDTKWRGINKMLLTGGWIFASSAKMNEFYLVNSGDDQKQYTMCHEVR